jgi:hypothetical protein
MEPTHPVSHEAAAERTDTVLQTVRGMSQQFMRCHWFMAEQTHKLADLLREAESRGILLHEAITLADVGYWLQHIDWQTKFLKVVLAFAQDPDRKTLRPLIELYGRDRERMRVEVEILARQLDYRVANFAHPGDAMVRKVVTKNKKRVLAVYLHVRSDYGGAALARLFKVPRSTAYGWLAWFDSLPEGLQVRILAFIDTQAPIMATCQGKLTFGVASAP